MSNELKLKETTLQELQQEIAISICENNIDSDSVYCGYSFKGLDNMTDVEVVQEYISQIWQRDELLDNAILELNADAMLKGIQMPEFEHLENLESSSPEDQDAQVKAMKDLLRSVAPEFKEEVQNAINQRIDFLKATASQ